MACNRGKANSSGDRNVSFNFFNASSSSSECSVYIWACSFRSFWLREAAIRVKFGEIWRETLHMPRKERRSILFDSVWKHKSCQLCVRWLQGILVWWHAQHCLLPLVKISLFFSVGFARASFNNVRTLVCVRYVRLMTLKIWLYHQGRPVPTATQPRIE